MFCCYEDSVIAAADEHGNLSYPDACRLLADHGVTWADLYEDPFALSQWPKVQAKNAETLLACLGY
jgi:hypothetical protein